MMALRLCCTVTLFPSFLFAADASSIYSLELKLEKMADYGASPWYTEDIKVGENQLKLSPDSGANFTWATSNLCHTDACNAHSKVNTSQPCFEWIDKTPTVRSFGPWGSMSTMTGEIAFNYVDEGNGKLTQGNMILYQKSSGAGPQNLLCVSTPSNTSSIAGTWYNSYCSQVSLSVSPVGKVSGIYTSHTGSTGSSQSNRHHPSLLRVRQQTTLVVHGQI